MRYPFTAESECERIRKIGQHLPILWARIKWVFFSEHSVQYSMSSSWLLGLSHHRWWQYCVLVLMVTTSLRLCCCTLM